MSNQYSVTIYVAAPGTPLSDGGTSVAGHVYYKLNNGVADVGFGFSPAGHGSSSGMGEISNVDHDVYKDPYYQRTLEISKAQYEKLKDFGERPSAHGFNMQYNGATNSCIDFTWGALNHASLYSRNESLEPDVSFDGALKPVKNKEYIESIAPPYPDSTLNTEKHNDMPKRTLLQRILTDADLPQNDRRMLEEIRTQVAGIDKQHGRTFDDTSERISLGLLVEAKQGGLQRIDHVVLGKLPADSAQQQMFAVQGRLDDPAHLRASMSIVAAVQTPPGQSFAKLEQVNQAQEQRLLAEQQDQHQQQSRPPRQMG